MVPLSRSLLLIQLCGFGRHDNHPCFDGSTVLILEPEMWSAQVKVLFTSQDPIAESRSHPLDQFDMLLVVCNNCHAGWHTVSTTDQPVQHAADRLSDVFVCLFHLVPLGVGIARQKSPVLDRANVKAWLRLRKAMKVKVLDERLKYVLMISNIGEGFGGIACW